MWMSCLTTSATRTSRIVWRTVRSASAAASSHESLLVPITSMTLYTLMTTLLDAVNPTPPVRRRPVNHQRARGLRDGARSVITVHDARSEGRQADGDVLRPAAGRAVTHPFARPGVHALAGLDRHPAAIELDDQGSPEHDRELVDLGPLPRLGPAGRAAHVATLSAVSPVLALPTYSSISFAGSPAAATLLGSPISSGMPASIQQGPS